MAGTMTIPRDQAIAFLDSLDGLDTMDGPAARFWFYDPKRDMPHDRRQPFATIVWDDSNDPHSDLASRGAYRLNLGVKRETYRALFGPEPKGWSEDGSAAPKGFAYTARDTLLPHPVYSLMGWVCIIDPSEATWPRVQALSREAHAEARRVYEHRKG